jgi:hypothetical protein
MAVDAQSRDAPARKVRTLANVAIMLITVDGDDHKLDHENADEMNELDQLMRRIGFPYDQGWARITGEPGDHRYVQLRHVVRAMVAPDQPG